MVKMRKAGAIVCILSSMLFFASCGKEIASTDNVTSVSESLEVSQETETSVTETENDSNAETGTETISDSSDNKDSSNAESNKEEVKDEKPTSTEQPDETEVKDLVLRDSIEDYFGGRIGCGVTGSEVNDAKVWEIVTTHFNAVTLGNELKPDCTFGYSNGTVPGTETITFNGEKLLVPKMDHSRADKILNKFLKWNEENPDRQIKIRGHVLVWHSQTPEWFFHVDYDKNKAYVDKDTMNKRLEWYIATMLTYYTGEDSKYKDLFYGWDVVNEAVSDGGGYRTDNENANEKLSNDTHGSNSSWWHVYGSNEYIINAFKYANKYAPAELELYYNDYNECNFNKQKSIIDLLTAVKEAEGEPGVGTRITAMGMQGHYGAESSNPSADNIGSAIKRYCKVVGAVQITELDLTINEAYDRSEEGLAAKNEEIKKRYNTIAFNIKAAATDSGVNVTGITFWGTVDQYSWLQSRSNVGGGNNNSLRQMPLLFGEDYLPKPCFYVFAKK